MNLGLFFVLLSLSFDCKPARPSKPLPVGGSFSLNSESVNQQQINSLRSVFYVGNPMPKPMSSDELLLLEKLKNINPDTIDRLNEVYFGNQYLMALAIRDTDSDGVPDYRISDEEYGVKFLGKFYAGDPDVDGDGIDNVFDLAPYTVNKDIEDSNLNGMPDVDGTDILPAHLVFDHSRYSPEVIDIQKKIFEAAGVALVERSQVFSEKLIYVTQDLLLNAYQSWFEGSKTLPSLKVISTEQFALLNSKIDDQTEGVFSIHDQTLTVFAEGQNHSPFVLFGLLAHELAHAYHYSMDFYGKSLEASSLSLPRTRFEKLIQGFGWKLKGDAELFTKKVYRDHWQDGVDQYSESTYLLKSSQDWNKLLIEAEYETVLFSALSKNFVLGAYAMSHPHEYYADGMMAYVLLQLERAFMGEKKAIKNMRTEILAVYGDFRYWFLLGGHSLESVLKMSDKEQKQLVPMYYHFSKIIPIPESTRQYLFEQYFKGVTNQ